MAILRRILIVGIALVICGAVYGLSEFRGPLRDVGDYWTASRLARIDDANELESVLTLSDWIIGGATITVTDNGAGAVTLAVIETDPCFALVDNHANWDTAFGWGDHSLVGYLTTLPLDGLSDVNAPSPADADVLTWDDANSQWIAAAAAGGGLQEADIDTFAELDAIVADKALVNMADGAVWLGVHDFGGATSLEVPNGANPTVDATAELAWESDDNDLHIYDSVRDVVIASKTKSRSFVIKGITSADDFPFWQTPRAITITKVAAICNGGTNVLGQLQEYNATAGGAVDVDAADWTITTSELEDTSFTNATIDAGDWIGFKTTSVSGTVSFFSLTFEYYEQ